IATAPMATNLSTSGHYDFTDLNDRSLVSVVRDVRHNLLRVRSKTGLKGFDRVAEDVAHSNVCRRSIRRSTSEPLVDRVVLAGIAQPGLDGRWLSLPIVFVVEARPGRVGVHNAHLIMAHLLLAASPTQCAGASVFLGRG